ncbi:MULTISPECIES: hypothetical protein [unclassified Cedecea]|uniref:hypothetical protein n=1 Tax=unclassified Cedecea TaxID=2649846 RepID=UPI003018ED7F
MEDQRDVILLLSSRPGGISAIDALDNGISLSVMNQMFDEGLLSIDIPISKNPIFRIIKEAA